MFGNIGTPPDEAGGKVWRLERGPREGLPQASNEARLNGDLEQAAIPATFRSGGDVEGPSRIHFSSSYIRSVRQSPMSSLAAVLDFYPIWLSDVYRNSDRHSIGAIATAADVLTLEPSEAPVRTVVRGDPL
jgi:hypothetical protein